MRTTLVNGAASSTPPVSDSALCMALTVTSSWSPTRAPERGIRAVTITSATDCDLASSSKSGISLP
ncbi:MAG: hypothetical protein R3B49_05335 [Phycisphaerales bacterium]